MLFNDDIRIAPPVKTNNSRERRDKPEKKSKKITNREKFERVFGLLLEEYNGWNDEFIIKTEYNNKIHANWLDAEYIRPSKRKES